MKSRGAQAASGTPLSRCVKAAFLLSEATLTSQESRPLVRFQTEKHRLSYCENLPGGAWDEHSTVHGWRQAPLSLPWQLPELGEEARHLPLWRPVAPQQILGGKILHSLALAHRQGSSPYREQIWNLVWAL